MSKEGTAWGNAVFKLVESGHTVVVTARPGHGQNKSQATVTASDESVVAKFTATDLSTLADEMVKATRNSGEVLPTTAVLASLDCMIKAGAAFRYVALTEKGEFVIHPEFNTPIQMKQRAATIKNGLAHGAAVVYDIRTGEVERISLAPVSK